MSEADTTGTEAAGMDPALDPAAVRRTGTERELLQAWLDYHRQTLRWKCSRLTPEQLCEASVPPSNLTLVGLARHMAEVERWWWRRVVAAEDIGDLYCTPEHEDGDFDLVDPQTTAADLDALESEIAVADRIFARAELDALVHHPRRDVDFTVRWVAQHMVEEWARHMGHADLLRERIDGASGS
jgi:hypothetical protein